MRRPLALALLLALLTLPSAEGQQSRFRGSGNAGMGRYVVTITVVTTESLARLLSSDPARRTRGGDRRAWGPAAHSCRRNCMEQKYESFNR